MTLKRPFFSLPLELRQEIYLLATPPRIVHVQEGYEDDYDDFLEKFLMEPNQLSIDPSIAYFAFNWRDHIPFRTRQRTLESFGITGANQQHPWKASPSTPEIPLHWLGENPKVAWELIRKSYLYSQAPIPALLHTCVQTRSELMSMGYELAFRTRSSEARTWCNFRRDTLFLECNDNYDWQDRWLLSGGRWDVSQFHPTDMQRVQRVALQDSARYLDGHSFRNEVHRISSIPRLFSALEELFLVEWTSWDVVHMWPRFIHDTWMGPKEQRQAQDEIDATRKHWQYITLEEIQSILRDFPAKGFWRYLAHEGHWTWLREKQFLGVWANPSGYRFDIPNAQLSLEQKLTHERDSILASNADSPWGIPKIKAIMVLPRSIIELISPERLMMVEELDQHPEWDKWVGLLIADY